MVPLQRSQASKVSEAGGHKAGHTGHGLKDDQSPFNGLHRRVVSLITRYEVERIVHAIHDCIDHFVPKCLRLVPIECAHFLLELILGPDVILLSTCVVTLYIVIMLIRHGRCVRLANVCLRTRVKRMGLRGKFEVHMASVSFPDR